MKKLLLGLALILLMTPAPAQPVEPVCWPDTSLPVSVERAETPTSAITYGEIVYAASPIGLVYGWTCKAPDGTYRKNIVAAAWDVMPRDWLFIADTLLRGTDADRVAAWRKYVTATEWDARLKTDIDKVWGLLPTAPPPPPPPPPPAVWKVMADPFRADKSRLVYTVVAGKRGPAATPTQYVPAGTPCDPVTLITENGPAYFASVLGNPNLIARCTK